MNEFVFADRLRAAMKQKGYRNCDLCRESYVSRSTIEKYLAGRTTPCLLIAARIADILDVSLDWLAGREGRSSACTASTNIAR